MPHEVSSDVDVVGTVRCCMTVVTILIQISLSSVLLSALLVIVLNSCTRRLRASCGVDVTSARLLVASLLRVTLRMLKNSTLLHQCLGCLS